MTDSADCPARVWHKPWLTNHLSDPPRSMPVPQPAPKCNPALVHHELSAAVGLPQRNEFFAAKGRDIT